MLGGFGLVAAGHHLMQREGDFVGMGGAPGDDAGEFVIVFGDPADLSELGFDLIRLSHNLILASGQC